MPRSSPKCSMPSSSRSNPCSRLPPTNTRSGATGHGCPTGSACGPCWSAWSPDAHGWTRSAWWATRSLTRRCARARRVDRCRSLRRPGRDHGCAPMKLPSGSISMTPWSTARSTKHPAVGRAPEKAQLTEENWAGSGRWPPTRTASRSAGWLLRPTATTRSCCPPRWRRLTTRDCSTRSRRCTSTAGYDNGVVRRHVAELGIAQVVVPKVRPKEGTTRRAPTRVPLGRRWPVERTNSWLSNYGQLRRNTDRKLAHRSAQLAFVIAILLIVRLLDGGHLQEAVMAPIRSAS